MLNVISAIWDTAFKQLAAAMHALALTQIVMTVQVKKVPFNVLGAMMGMEYWLPIQCVRNALMPTLRGALSMLKVLKLSAYAMMAMW